MDQDISALRRQMQQLQELHDTGALGEEAYRQGRETLERRIVDQVMSGAVEAPAPALPSSAEPPPPPPRMSGALLASIGAGVLVVAAAGYWWTGSPQMAAQPQPGATAGTEVGSEPGGAAPGAVPASAPHAFTTDQIAGMVDKLARRLKEAPEDAEGWAMLARSYAVLGRHADALPAYKKAVALRDNDPTLLADYADALAVANERNLSGEPLALIQRALKIDPDNLKALSLAGTAAFDRKDYAGAVKHWERIVAVAPAGSPQLQQVQAGLAEARELGRLPVPAAPPAAASAAPVTAASAIAAAGAGVSGTVSLATGLRAKADPNDTVFVFARAAEGPRMPLAIVRKQVKDLPFEFTLDDSTAMSPTTRLSSQKSVVVGARVSKSGNAMPQPGDLSGQTPTVEVGVRGLKLEISQVVAK